MISTSPGTCGDVIAQLSKRPEVLEIHEVAGEHDLFVKLVTEDTLKLNELLHEMDKIPGVSSNRTLVVLKTEKETGAVALTDRGASTTLHVRCGGVQSSSKLRKNGGFKY